ncbi:MAG: hypothetical protein IPI58_03195 [Alphaproteobacteria bacterium]|nr:MAG: hypothetical protein IPI58_03195 [Alphaproteobacteria bacterium]
MAILAVIASAIAAGSGGFNSDTSAISAKAYATAILEYAASVKMGVDRVLGKGCTDTQVSFENPFVSGYENPNAPSDKSCHVFDVNGGGMNWVTPPAGALNQANFDASNSSIKSPFGNNLFTTICVANTGTGGYGTNGATNPCYYIDSATSSDLTMILPWVSKDICLQINGLVGFKNIDATTPPKHGSYKLYFTFFSGSYSGNYGSIGGLPIDTTWGNPDNNGMVQGCMSATTQWQDGTVPGGGYFYFRVLIAR